VKELRSAAKESEESYAMIVAFLAAHQIASGRPMKCPMDRGSFRPLMDRVKSGEYRIVWGDGEVVVERRKVCGTFVPVMEWPDNGNPYGYTLDEQGRPLCKCGAATVRTYVGTPDLPCWSCGNLLPCGS
jgi:hypothetical protein